MANKSEQKTFININFLQLFCQFIPGNTPLESGIHIILVVGYGWSKVLLALNSLVSSSRLIICTLLLYSSTKLPRANRKRLSGRTLQFIEYKGHGATYLYISFRLPVLLDIFVLLKINNAETRLICHLVTLITSTYNDSIFIPLRYSYDE